MSDDSRQAAIDICWLRKDAGLGCPGCVYWDKAADPACSVIDLVRQREAEQADETAPEVSQGRRVSAWAKPRLNAEQLLDAARYWMLKIGRTCSVDLARLTGVKVGRARYALDTLVSMGEAASQWEPSPGTGNGRRYYSMK